MYITKRSGGASSCRLHAVGLSSFTKPNDNNLLLSTNFPMPKFLASELHIPAVLFRILLLRAGIAANPGPPPKPVKYPCQSCQLSAFNGSIQCSSCQNWVHSKKKCSNLNNIGEFNASTFRCSACFLTPNNYTPIINLKINNNNNNKNSNNADSNNINKCNNKLCFLQWNANGISNKLCELEVFLYENKVDIAAIQETKLKKSSKDPKISGYRIIRCDRTSNTVGGGLAFLVRSDIIVVEVKLPASSIDNTLETIAIGVSTNAGELILVNVYVPPVSSCPPNYVPPLTDIFDMQHTLVVGDFNAHHHLWHSSLNDARGNFLADIVDGSGMLTLNENKSTRCPSNANQRNSSPDISFACSEIATLLDWKCVNKLGSDHLPILLNFDASANLIVAPRTTFVNFNKANWPLFNSTCEEFFSNPPIPALSSVHQQESFFRTSIIKAAKIAIPTGRRKFYDPALTDRIAQLVAERDAIRTADRTSSRIAELNTLIAKEANEEKTRKWRNFVSNLDYKCDSKKLWNMIKILDGKSKPPVNTSITFENKTLNSSSAIANAFVKMFTTVRKHTSSRHTRQCNRFVLKKSLAEVEFTLNDVTNAIKSSKNSKALGPDALAMPYLKQLGPNGILFLTNLINKSFSLAIIPDNWKTSTIVPLTKPGKDPKHATSYRPISLLSPVAKLMERLLLPSLNQHLPPADHQHGFRSGHSTTSALLHITNAISTGFNDKQPPRRTMVVALDLSKAFDSVDHDILRKILVKSTLPGWQVRWLSNYLRGRIARATFRNETSSARLCRTGVPQGSVISPALFNAYLRDMPLPSTPTQLVSYADDISIFTSGVVLKEMELQLTSYLKILGSFLADRKLIISAAKSSVTLFTPDPAQYSYKPTVIVNDVVLPLEQHLKILGLTFDPKFTFTNHAANVTKKVQQKNQVLKALAGRNWGQNKETILMTYKATSRAVMNYAAPAWTPTLSQTNFDKLQCKQNNALRTATGCLRLAPIKHLHQETLILPVQLHCRLLTDQYFSTCRRDDHPCRHLYGFPGPPRIKKLTLEMHSKSRVQRATASLVNKAKPCSIRAVQRKLHEKAVHRTRIWIGNNSILNIPPPKINADEVSLPRATRAHLAQLRSGYSYLLAKTRSRLDKTGLTSSRCPYCLNDDEDVPHVFACRKRHVNCNLLDLWYRPSTVATEIGL